MTAARPAHALGRRSLGSIGIALLLAILFGCDGSGSSSSGSGPEEPGGSEGGSVQPAIVLEPAPSSLVGVTVGEPVLVGSRRLTRTTFEYVYSVAVSNTGTQRFVDVVGTVTSDSAATVVADASVSFGALAAGASVPSADTFSIRQDRLSPVGSAALRIALSGRVPDPNPAEGVLLEGAPSAPALPALFDLLPVAAGATDNVEGVLLTRLDWVLERDVTIGEVNAALGAVGGGIVGMRAGRPALVVAVPRQADAAALAALAEEASALPGIALAFPGQQAAVALAPPTPADADVHFGYLRDAGFPAAWNARAAAVGCSEPVTVLAADHYHRPIDSLYNDFADQVPGLVERGTGSVEASDFSGYHGYDVWTTLSARLDSTVPTGALPFSECLQPVALQIYGQTPYGWLFAIEDAIPAEGHVVLNVSLSYPTCGDCDQISQVEHMTQPLQRGAVGAFARTFLDAVRDRLLLVQASGNYRNERASEIYPGLGSAEYVSPFAVAARSDATMSWVEAADLWRPDPGSCGESGCLPSLVPSAEDVDLLRMMLDDLLFASTPPSENVLIVGSATRDFTNSPSEFSNEPADVRAVGENIPTLLGVPAAGTSFSAPQVAALATYLWTLSPELRAAPVAETIAAIRANASATGMISAYATVLSLDSGRPLSPANSRIRLAILDVDDNGDFDELDLDAYLAALRPGGLDIDPSSRDDSRHDLNGDGFTGGPGTVPFDLDPEESPRFGRRRLTNVTTEILGVLETYDEIAVTDIDALCYYAHSPLFTGDPEIRRERLFDVCSAGEQTWVGSWTYRRQYTADAGEVLTPASGTVSDERSVTIRAVLVDGEFDYDGSASRSLSSVSVSRLNLSGTRTCRRTDHYSGSGPANWIILSPSVAVISGDTEGSRSVTDTCITPPFSEVAPASLSVNSDPGLNPTVFDENGEPIVYSYDENTTRSGPWGRGTFSETTTITGRLTRIR